MVVAHTGENEQALQKIIDFIRLLSIVVLLSNFYFFCHHAFKKWGLAFEIVDRVALSISNTGIFSGIFRSKLFALGLLIISLIGAKGKKDEKINLKGASYYIASGLSLFLPSHYIFLFKIPDSILGGIYIAITSVGYILILT